MAIARNSASLLLIVLSAASFARGTVYRCVAPDGRVTLRDEHCHPRERIADSVRSSDVPRDFSVVFPPPAAAGKIVIEPVAAPEKKSPAASR